MNTPPLIVGQRTATELWVGAEQLQSWIWSIKIPDRTREHHNHPQTVRTVIVSAPYRYRSFSRERTCMDLEDPNGVSEEDIGLPTSLTEFQT